MAAKTDDFFGEGTWADPEAPGFSPYARDPNDQPDAYGNSPNDYARDPNDQPNPSNPGGMSNNDLWNQVEFNRAMARSTANSNLGVHGGLGTDPRTAAGQAPILTTGIRGGEFQRYDNGQTLFPSLRHTAGTQAALDDYGLGTTTYDSNGNVVNHGRDALGAGNNRGVITQNGYENNTDFTRGASFASSGAALGGKAFGAPGMIIGGAVGWTAGNNRRAGGSGGTITTTEGTGAPIYSADGNTIIGYRGGTAGVNATGPGTPGSTTPGPLPAQVSAPGALPIRPPGGGVMPVAGMPGGPVTSGAADQANAQGDALIAGAAGAAGRTDAANMDVRAFLDEERNRKGSSEAEALLNKTADRIQAQALGIAAGARGGAAARERATNQAISGNAFVGASATQDLATLRAREDAQKRDRLTTIMNLMSANAGRGDVLQQGQVGQAVDLYGRGIGATQAAEGNASAASINAANNASNERSTIYAADRHSDDITRQNAFTHSERKDQEPGFLEGVATSPQTPKTVETIAGLFKDDPVVPGTATAPAPAVKSNYDTGEDGPYGALAKKRK